MHVLLTFALRSELAPWLRLREFRRKRLGSWTSYETTMGALKVCALLTGMGPAHAQAAVRAALETKPDAVIATGLAGALNYTYRAGDVLAARRVYFEGAWQHIDSSEELLDFAQQCGAQPAAAFLSSARLARTAAEKNILRPLADAVDMESFPVLREACAAGVPAIALRAVADTAECGLPCDFTKMTNGRGQLHLWRVALQPVLAPQRAPALLRFALASHHAASCLARFLDVYVRKLTC